MLLLRRSETDPDDVGARSPNAPAHRRDLVRRLVPERRRLGPDHLEAGGPPRHRLGELGGDAGRAAEEEVAPPGRDSRPAQNLDRLDPGHLADAAKAAQAADDRERFAVGRDQEGVAMRVAQPRIVLGPHDAMRVAKADEGSRLFRAAVSQPALDGADETVHVDDGDGHAAKLEAGRLAVMPHGRLQAPEPWQRACDGAHGLSRGKERWLPHRRG